MLKSHRRICFMVVVLCAGVLRAQEAGTRGSQPQSRMTTSRLFSCEIPFSWNDFEEEDALGAVFHALGPDDPTASYRAGLSVRWVEPEQTGYVEPKKAVDLMRRSDRVLRRSVTPVLPMRVAGLLARVFEVTETRVLPLERLPAGEKVIHRYVAVIPDCAGYYVVRLSSAREVYLLFPRRLPPLPPDFPALRALEAAGPARVPARVRDQQFFAGARQGLYSGLADQGSERVSPSSR